LNDVSSGVSIGLVYRPKKSAGGGIGTNSS